MRNTNEKEVNQGKCLALIQTTLRIYDNCIKNGISKEMALKITDLNEDTLACMRKHMEMEM